MKWRGQLHSFAHGYTVVPAAFIEEIFAHWNFMVCMSKINWSYLYWSIFRISVLFLYLSISSSIPYRLDYCRFIISLNISRVIPPNLFLSFQILLAILIPLLFPINFRASSLIWEKYFIDFDRSCIKIYRTMWRKLASLINWVNKQKW